LIRIWIRKGMRICRRYWKREAVICWSHKSSILPVVLCQMEYLSGPSLMIVWKGTFVVWIELLSCRLLVSTVTQSSNTVVSYVTCSFPVFYVVFSFKLLIRCHIIHIIKIWSSTVL
jgi:hypothetical protein